MDKSSGIAQGLLEWHDRNARVFPWSHQTDPYRIWASEIMLQQTRAETVVSYYERFIKAYPDVRSLARAELKDVLKLFEGLGYYARFRNLHKAAKRIDSMMGGAFPREVKALQKLPGVGEYTAGAVASIAFNIPAPAIDGNQRRVLSRLFAVGGLPNNPKTREALTEAARGILLNGRPGDMNQALMGLGAMVCTSSKPRCADCCVRGYCEARALGVVDRLPERAPKKDKPVKKVAVALIFSEEDGGRVFVRRRPDGALLGGMWEFPCFVENVRDASECARALGIAVRGFERLGDSRHVFTHLVWEMTGYACMAMGAPDLDGVWADVDTLLRLPMSAALRPYRELAVERLTEPNG